MLFSDEYFMQRALQEAKIAFEKDEVPVGAIVVLENKIIGRGHNLTETLNDVTAHAEMQALTAAFNFLGAKYLPQATLYVSLEPCPMCAGAIYWSKLGRLVYGAADDKHGFHTCCGPHPFHPKTIVQQGLLASEGAALMQDFFRSKRQRR